MRIPKWLQRLIEWLLELLFPKPPEPTVDIIVCRESELLPSNHCKSLTTKTYVEGEEPTQICDFCESPEPSSPYIGTSFYQADSFPIEQVEWFLEGIAQAGGNATEFFILHTWYDPHHQPWIQVDTWTDNKFPGIEFPMWDLDQFDEVKWDKWRTIFRLCREKGIVPFVRIEDFCSFKAPLEKRYYFNYASYQRIVLKPIKGKKWWEDETMWQKSRLNNKVLQTLVEADCKKFFIIPMSEADTLDNLAADRKKNLLAYHDWVTFDLESAGCPPEQIILCPGRALEEHKKLGYKIEYHGCNSDIKLNQIIAKYGVINIFPNGDGYDIYAEGRRGSNPRAKEPSIAQGVNMGRIIRDNNLFGYCHFNQDTERLCEEQDGFTDLMRAKFDVLRALIKGYNAS